MRDPIIEPDVSGTKTEFSLGVMSDLGQLGQGLEIINVKYPPAPLHLSRS